MNSVLKVTARSIGILAVIIVVSGGIALAIGAISISIKQPTQAVAAYNVTCDNRDIQQYNDFVTTFVQNNDQQKQKATQMQALLDTLKKKSGFDNDPTCRFIAYSTAIVAGDAAAAQTQYDALKTFSDEGIYPTNKLLDIVSLGSMKDRIEALKRAGQGSSNQMGSG